MNNDFNTARDDRRSKLNAHQKDLAAKGVKFLQVHLPDINGNFRSKLTPLKFSTEGEAVNCNFFCVAHGEGAPLLESLFAADISCEANGYPNMRGLIDPDTVRHHSWAPEWGSAIVDSFQIEGKANVLDARGLLRAQQERAKTLGFESKFALEYEFGIFQIDEEAMRAGRYRDLKPWGYGDINYSLTRAPGYQKFFSTLIDRLANIGVGMPSVTTEYGVGMYEFALGVKPPLEAADDAVRAKAVLQELCLDNGLIATFMARFMPPGQHSACGAHHHQSLWRDGHNVFAAGPNALSDIGRHYLGGLLKHLPATHLIFRPTINSYRRFEKNAWSPVEVGWGYEDRTRSVRAITTPFDGAARFEHRVPGADVNPYLTVTAMLAAGLDGIENAIDPDELAPKALPSTLEASMEEFASDDFVRANFGEPFQKHYLASRQFEIDSFRKWQEQHITDFEFKRYFVGT